MANNQQEAIENVLSRFNFQEVHDYMKNVKWTWAFSSSPDNIPTVDDLKDEARRLFSEATRATPGHARVSTGGFEARIDRWEGTTLVTLNFIPFRKEDWYKD